MAIALISSAEVYSFGGPAWSHGVASAESASFAVEGGPGRTLIAALVYLYEGTLSLDAAQAVVSYGGQPMDLIHWRGWDNITQYQLLSVFALHDPPAGSGTFAWETRTGAGAPLASRGLVMVACEFDGLDQDDPVIAETAATHARTISATATVEESRLLAFAQDNYGDSDFRPFTPAADNALLFDTASAPSASGYNAVTAFVGISGDTDGESSYAMGATTTGSAFPQFSVIELRPGPVPDPDAGAYVAAVEAADGQALEPGIAAAIHTFVAGLKADGLWASIDQCCLMAGARTLAGALVPLRGDPMQSVTAFVQEDYDRVTGLKGDGASTWINASMTSFGQDDAHLAVYLGEAHDTDDATGRCFLGNNNSAGGSRLDYVNRNRRPMLNGDGVSNIAGTGFEAGLYGTSRSSPTAFQERYNGTTLTHSRASVPPSGNGLRVFARQFGGGGANGYTLARLSWFSHGRAIDLGALDARLDTFHAAVATALADGDGVTGDLSVHEAGADIASVRAVVAVSGVLAPDESGPDLATFTGMATVAGPLAIRETGQDTVAITGIVAAAAATGHLAVQEVGADGAALGAAVRVRGMVAPAETGADAASLAGRVAAALAVAAKETGADGSSLPGSLAIRGMLAPGEVGTDVAALSGTVRDTVTFRAEVEIELCRARPEAALLRTGSRWCWSGGRDEREGDPDPARQLAADPRTGLRQDRDRGRPHPAAACDR